MPLLWVYHVRKILNAEDFVANFDDIVSNAVVYVLLAFWRLVKVKCTKRLSFS